MVGDIFGYDCTGTYKGVSSDGDAADDGAVCAQGSAFFNPDRPGLIHFAHPCTRVINIGEDHWGAAEYVVFQGYVFIDRYIVLDFALIAYLDFRSNDDVLADVAVFADVGAGHDVAEVPDFGSFAYLAVVVDVGWFVYEILQNNLQPLISHRHTRMYTDKGSYLAGYAGKTKNKII